MKYKNIDMTVENLRKFKTSEVYKATYPKFFEFYIDKSKDEKSFFLKIWKDRLIVSIDRLKVARLAQVETEAKGKPIYQKVKPLYKKTDTNIIQPIYKKTGTNTVSTLLDQRS